MLRTIARHTASRTVRQQAKRTATAALSSTSHYYHSQLQQTKQRHPVVVVRPRHLSTKVDRHEFQAETRQLLDIVTHSIYTDKEVFIRELISNASDALEKLRHLQATGETIVNGELEPQILITTDEKNRTLTISDTGVGMSKAELIENLGTIARSGSKAFLEQLKKKNSDTDTSQNAEALSGIIGKFGVGFYSAFMVADKVEVFTRSAISGSEQSHVWRSDGSGAYEISVVGDDDIDGDQLKRGCQIVIHLKENCMDYVNPQKIESIIRQYSNFVSFPIFLNDQKINTVQALWTKNEKEITEEEYTEFYKFIANAFDEPLYHLHFKADAPLELKTLFFIGKSHTEKFGYARLEPGVSLYSRKILIERNSIDILPDWCRFIRGVVDSEDLPLSLSREKMQDSRMILKLKDVLTRRIIRFLEQEKNKNPEKFERFFEEFGQFIKEGICTDFQHKNTLAKLLRYETSTLKEKKTCSLDEYISRLAPEQNEIFFLCAPNRQLAQASPYFEAFEKTNKEVLFVYSPMDDFVMNNIGEYNGRKVISAEQAAAQLLEEEEEEEEKEEEKDNDNLKEKQKQISKLTKEEQKELSEWLKKNLSTFLKEVKFTNRLSKTPAMISDHENASIRKMMSMINDRTGKEMPNLNKYTLEVNPRHRMIIDLNQLRQVNDPLATKIAKQIYTNASIAAGLIDDGRTVLTELNDVLGELLTNSLHSKKKEQ